MMVKEANRRGVNYYFECKSVLPEIAKYNYHCLNVGFIILYSQFILINPLIGCKPVVHIFCIKSIFKQPLV